MVQPVQCTPMSKDKKKYDISDWTKAADQMSTAGPKYAVLYGADFFFFFFFSMMILVIVFQTLTMNLYSLVGAL